MRVISMKKHILMIVTSADTMTPSNKETGIWLSEFAEPYIAFTKAGMDISVASPKGGKAPVDSRSLQGVPPAHLDTAKHLEQTMKLSDVRDTARYDAVFLPGGHGAMFDLSGNSDLNRILREMHKDDKIMAAVCHGPAGLTCARLDSGDALVAGKRLTAFTNAEEKEIELDGHMPFLLETRLKELGAHFVQGKNWEDHVEVDGNLITGQNPQSAQKTAAEVLRALSNR